MHSSAVQPGKGIGEQKLDLNQTPQLQHIMSGDLLPEILNATTTELI